MKRMIVILMLFVIAALMAPAIEVEAAAAEPMLQDAPGTPVVHEPEVSAPHWYVPIAGALLLTVGLAFMAQDFTARYVDTGETVDYTPSTAVNAGDVVVLGTKRIGIAKHYLEADVKGSLVVSGEAFDGVKDTTSASAIAVGSDIYWDPTSEVATDSAAPGNIGPIGWNPIAAAADDETVRVILNQA